MTELNNRLEALNCTTYLAVQGWFWAALDTVPLYLSLSLWSIVQQNVTYIVVQVSSCYFSDNMLLCRLVPEIHIV